MHVGACVRACVCVSCSRPAALDDRPLDSDDDDFGRDRDFDLPPSPTSFLSGAPHSPHPLAAASDSGAGDDAADEGSEDTGPREDAGAGAGAAADSSLSPSLGAETGSGSGSGSGSGDAAVEDAGVSREAEGGGVAPMDVDAAAGGGAKLEAGSLLLADRHTQAEGEDVGAVQRS